MKVAFYLFNIYPDTINLKDVSRGNPGIGGTEYMMLLLLSALHYRDNNIRIRLYSSRPGIFDDSLDVKVMENYEDAARDALNDGFERFIINSKEVKWHKTPFVGLGPELKIIVWCHNLSSPESMKLIADNPSVGRIICVSNEQKDLYRDHSSFRKIQCIRNCIPLHEDSLSRARSIPNCERKHIVTCITSIYPQKGFHTLARIWPLILKEVPDAQLYVIGSGNLYFRNAKLGKYQVASEAYENIFMQYLTEDGKILDSVHFMGILGVEKEEILLKTKVGAFPSPMESFGLGAVEMQSLGCSVVTMQTMGSFDVVCNGKVAKNEIEFSKYIIELLTSNQAVNFNKTVRYIRDNFSIENISAQWEKMLTSELTENQSFFYPIKHLSYRYKWLKELIRWMKYFCPLFRSDNFFVERLLRKVHYDGSDSMYRT